MEIPKTETDNKPRKKDKEERQKKQTFPLTMIQQSFLWLCLDTSSKVKVLGFEAIFDSATQNQAHTNSHIILQRRSSDINGKRKLKPEQEYSQTEANLNTKGNPKQKEKEHKKNS